jgi:hypothetical protein
MKTDIMKMIMYDSIQAWKLRVLPRVKPPINGDENFESSLRPFPSHHSSHRSCD